MKHEIRVRAVGFEFLHHQVARESQVADALFVLPVNTFNIFTCVFRRSNTAGLALPSRRTTKGEILS